MTDDHAEHVGPPLPATLRSWRDGAVAVLQLNRADKRNALDDATVLALGAWFAGLPRDVGAVVLTGDGPHFCAGLDLSQLEDRSVFEGVEHSRMWHRALACVEDGRVPVFSVLHGAVIGGGLELASATHVRVAEGSAFYALPEGQHGIFVGGGASVRVPRLIGAARMMDMMLTGRRYDAEEGGRIGLSQYVVEDGEGLPTALRLAHRAAGNSAVTNYAVLQALPLIAGTGSREGYLMEALMAGIAQGTDDAKERMRAFLAGARPADRTPEG
jgi:(methylthio)acryloyl-CoA hydratase